MSNQRPGSVVEFKNSGKKVKPTIGFNDDGICDACKYHDIKENDRLETKRIWIIKIM